MATTPIERQDSWVSTELNRMDSVSSVLLSESTVVTDLGQASEAPKKKARKRGKHRLTAAAKDAKVRARNRRAQQAFRQRQKALAMERSTSLVRLEGELACLQDANRNLQQALQQARTELAKERAINANTVRVAQHQDLQMMAIFGDSQLVPSFPSAQPANADHFPAFWIPQLENPMPPSDDSTLQD